MSGQTSFRVRRATVDDLGPLIEMWGAMQFDALELERRLTEFQVAEMEDGQVLGAVGLQVLSRDGLVHHEAFADFALADSMRDALWDRLQKVAENHGLLRVWTKETAPFWSRSGFLPPSRETLAFLPPGFDPEARWLLAKFREEADQPTRPVEAEFEAFLETERQKTERLAQHAKTLNTVATVIALLLFLGVVAALVYFFINRPK